MTAVNNRQAVAATSDGWIALSSEQRILVVGGSPNEQFVATLWAAIAEPDGLQRTLDLVMSNGLSATPPFALLDYTAALRVILRGDVTVAVTHAGALESLSGAGVSTWIERSIIGATTVSLVVDNAVAAAVPALPLSVGAAWIASMSVGEVAAPVTVAAPATDERPVVVIDNLETSPEGYDYEVGDTMYRSVADAAVRDEPQPEPAAEPEFDSGDHDGETVLVSATDSGDHDGQTVLVSAADSGDHDGQTVLVPSADSGDHDGQTVVASDIAKLRRERLATATDIGAPPAAPVAPAVSLVLADGTREPLIQPILVGRSPSVSQVSGGNMPKLIVVGGADQDISRTHVRFALEGGTVVVTDLHSRNGTTIALPGKEPQQLRAGEPTSVIVGTLIDLGGGVTFTVDEATV